MSTIKNPKGGSTTTRPEKGSARLQPLYETERAQFKSLILQNPNYFGNLKESEFKAVLSITGNTTYEELTCVGYNPRLRTLEATVQIKLPTGFKGNLCGPGSTEYVRFYVDYGAGWQDVDCVAFDTHDIPNMLDCAKDPDKPLSYVVSLKFEPKTDNCERPVMPNVRAILSWETMPPLGDPLWPPIWGNVLDQHIQIAPRKWNIGDLVGVLGKNIGQTLKVPPEFEEVIPQPIPLPDPPPLELAELVKLYGAETAKGEKAATIAKTSVELHRFGFAQIHALSAGALQQEVATTQIAEWKKFGIDLPAAIAALDKVQADVTYEEVECLGLDNNYDWLGATFRIKRPTGYSGDLCHPGSFEYIAFWADWDNECKWTYLDTVEINVHDIASIPADGLAYTALLPVDLTYHRQNCEKPKIARIRAVLSWAVAPSTVDPDALTTWGNRLDVHVQIRPGEPYEPGTAYARIRSLGGIPIENINTAPGGDGMTMSFGGQPAKFWYNDALADPLGRDCPFGGQVLVHGPWFYGFKYRVKVHKAGDPATSFTTLIDSFNVLRNTVGYDTQIADASGFFTYLNPALYFESNILAVWNTSGDAMWEVQLDIADMADNVLASTPWYHIQLDNTAPTALPLMPPTLDVRIDPIVGGDCSDIDEGTTITGTFVARDIHFGHFQLTTLPNTASTPSNNPTTPVLSTSESAPYPSGSPWSLNTGAPVNMEPCGYVVLLEVWDRSIVGSVSGQHNSNRTSVGFCLRKKSA